MKLSWKLFFITTPVFLLFLTFFGAWMIQGSFQSSLEQEIDRCMVENQMFQNSYELTLHSLSEEQKEQASLNKMIRSFHRSSENGNTRILDENGRVLYQENDLERKHGIMEQLDQTNNAGCELFQEGGHTYVVVMCVTSFGEYIETIRDITSIFEKRAEQYSNYQIGVLLVAFLVGVVILFVLFIVMQDMQKLSRATRQFARGQYQTRVKIRSRDEIGLLASDFNWMANEMNNQMEKLRNEVRRQEEFTASFAHELKTPLTSIIGYADTIRQMDLTPEETDMCADYIYRQGKRLQSLSYKLLDMTMADKQEIIWKRIPVPGLLKDVERMLLPVLGEKQITLEVHVQTGMIYGDRDLLTSLFLNLVDNARKASGAGTKIRVTGRALPGGYTVIVEDQGNGIPSEEISRITEAFYMVDKSRARKEGGAGLGLALCQKILEMHQGGWQFESEPGVGTKVTVLFGVPEEMQRKLKGRRSVNGLGKRKLELSHVSAQRQKSASESEGRKVRKTEMEMGGIHDRK